MFYRMIIVVSSAHYFLIASGFSAIRIKLFDLIYTENFIDNEIFAS